MDGKSFIDPIALIEATEKLLEAFAEGIVNKGSDNRIENRYDGGICDEEEISDFHLVEEGHPIDANKVFGICIRVDEPRAEDYENREDFERDHEKYDRLVEAAEACDWENKDNEAPLHRVDAIKRRIEDGPVCGIDLIGETQWW